MIGRNFDYEISYKEEIITIKRWEYGNAYSIIGVCTGVVSDYPLMYDGMNECGLVCGGLAFKGNAYYIESDDSNPFEDIPMHPYNFVFEILGRFKDVKSVRKWLKNVIIVDEQYSDEMPNTDLHWFIADKNDAIVIEQTEDGLNIYDAETSVMTNNPPYPMQIDNYNTEKDYIGCCVEYNSEKWFTRGMETDNLQGGYTSEERFIRASYLLKMVDGCGSPFNDVTETFHLLGSVEQIYGATPVNDSFEYTIYSVVYDIERGVMWIKTYDKICPNNYMITDSERIPL